MNDHPKKRAVTVTVSPAVLKLVEHVMRATDRSRSWIANEALRKFCERDEAECESDAKGRRFDRR